MFVLANRNMWGELGGKRAGCRAKARSREEERGRFLATEGTEITERGFGERVFLDHGLARISTD